jgi:hypothetical protein
LGDAARVPGIGDRPSPTGPTRSIRPVVESATRPRPTCLRCGFAVTPKAWGCKNPCDNCGFVYPLGDCSD